MDIKLGDLVTDKVSGIKGIAVSKCEYLNGCVQYGITPKGKSTATDVVTIYVDKQQIEVVKKKALSIESSPVGGKGRKVKNSR